MNKANFFWIALLSGALLNCAPVRRAVDGTTKKFCGKYYVVEKFKVEAGAETGYKGETNYTINLLPGAKDEEIVIEKFANSYKVNAGIKGDSLAIPLQKFSYRENPVFISGGGKFTADTLYYHYSSGGPAGRINCECKAVRSNK